MNSQCKHSNLPFCFAHLLFSLASWQICQSVSRSQTLWKIFPNGSCQPFLMAAISLQYRKHIIRMLFLNTAGFSPITNSTMTTSASVDSVNYTSGSKTKSTSSIKYSWACIFFSWHYLLHCCCASFYGALWQNHFCWSVQMSPIWNECKA